METTLHQQLKLLYASSPEYTEVTMHGFRIDAVASDGELIEIQHGSLGALRDKTRRLLATRGKHRLRIVKPIIARRRVTTVDQPDGQVLRSRMSPKTCDWTELFMDLVHFCTVFPRRRLTLEALLIEVEEFRLDRPPRPRRSKPYRSLDLHLTKVCHCVTLQSLSDLVQALPTAQLPDPFDTAALAQSLGRPRWFAQKVAYCLRTMGAVESVSRRGNAHQYQWSLGLRKAARRQSVA